MDEFCAYGLMFFIIRSSGNIYVSVKGQPPQKLLLGRLLPWQYRHSYQSKQRAHVRDGRGCCVHVQVARNADGQLRRVRNLKPTARARGGGGMAGGKANPSCSRRARTTPPTARSRGPGAHPNRHLRRGQLPAPCEHALFARALPGPGAFGRWIAVLETRNHAGANFKNRHLQQISSHWEHRR